ncbi:hypothetical protein SGR_7109t [Streptomyces griseus subsp. griseus NBRC 13350]|uniref:Uncharacterized protein n=1 Tax=Streptomyces griseus subsp. griseus (strain JCM 4626 / CBS 651.72 / NBRC 13350 / KCC S-0626 / ISP 5235) TaxID=455632 RepID=B1VKN3_STRGG|nr:hypothetical protein [Streptomyces griseus]BAG16859.1 hypothetical protein SGR_30t [Streptomyces griseus subsp. griseus NBRC 13350]BAG23936.1 hypothetical protein SGR_7109t [Streptomyces griseus subsp. griseus NBRC 13350]
MVLLMKALKLLGPWHQEAAARALSGTDQDVLDYLRTRWKEANHNDIRQRVVELSTQSPYTSVRTVATEVLSGTPAQSPYTSVRTVATEVLSGTPAQIEAFYTDGQYEAGIDDMKVDVARLTSTGGPGVAEAAKAALRNGSALALAKFLKIGQYGEHITDERVTAARLTNTGGPEVVAAATTALAGDSGQAQAVSAVPGCVVADPAADLAANGLRLPASDPAGRVRRPRTVRGRGTRLACVHPGPAAEPSRGRADESEPEPGASGVHRAGSGATRAPGVRAGRGVRPAGGSAGAG